MSETAELVLARPRPKPAPKGFRLPAVTPEMASKVGEMVGNGVKLETALAALDVPITLEHWDRATKQHDTGGSILRAFRVKCAQAEIALLKRVAAGTSWQAASWLLERSRGYAVPKGPGVVVNVNTINGMTDDVWERAKQFVSVKQAKVKQVTDV